MWRGILAASLACFLVVSLAQVLSSCGVGRPNLAGFPPVEIPPPTPTHGPQSAVAVAVARDSVWLGRVGGAVAVVGLALAVGLRSKALLYVSLAGAAALVAAIAFAVVVPWLPLVALCLAIGGVLLGLAYLAIHHRRLAQVAAIRPPVAPSLACDWRRLRACLLARADEGDGGPGNPAGLAPPAPDPIHFPALR